VFNFWVGSPYAISGRCLSCLSVMLVYCGQMVGWIRMPLGMEIGLGSGDIVLDGDPCSSPKGAQPRPPQFLTHACYGQRPGWIKMLHGTEVGLGPGHIVLDGHSSRSPVFGACLSWPNGRPSKQLLNSFFSIYDLVATLCIRRL